MTQIAPSILSADFGKLAAEVQAVAAAGADLIHVDVMDGHFVQNITAGPIMVKAVRGATKLFIDTHLMIESPEKYIEAFAKAGSDSITVHAEACPNLAEVLRIIEKVNVQPAVAINPTTSLEPILGILDRVQMVLVMTVHPGFASQKMIPECLTKVTQLRALLKQRKLKTKIEVDGGVNLENIAMCAQAGADIIVSGSAIFGTKDYAKTISQMKQAIG